MEGFCSIFKINPNRTRIKRFAMAVGMLACAALVFRTFSLPSQRVTPPSFPTTTATATILETKFPKNASRIADQVSSVGSNSGDYKSLAVVVDTETEENDSDFHAEEEEEEEVDLDKELSTNIGGGVALEKIEVSEDNLSSSFSSSSSSSSSSYGHPPLIVIEAAVDMNKRTVLLPSRNNSDLNSTDSNSSINVSLAATIRMLKKKKKRDFPTNSISEMNQLLAKARRSYRTAKPLQSSVHDQQIYSIRTLIDRAWIAKNDPQLHGPAFRNVSMFKRSYDLMEQKLKVYVYKEGKRPIFHQALLKGIYASEGWFMKLMEGNRRYVVGDPRKANMFYMPFSSRFLQLSLYVPNSHNRTNLRRYLKNYVDRIAGKYPFWNRTSGGDHFLVACHDWAPYETKHTMERSIRGLCNADLAEGFRVGKDVSVPETYVRSGRNPQRDIGGKPANERSILAFYAGSMHGYLRTLLVEYWESKEEDMKIYGPMPPGVKSKMNYRDHMKSSKYCLCPRGYGVNSPRVVEAIFYECVPVILSDNYVPPFLEVLNWEEFAVFVKEVDIPRLDQILRSIPEDKYLSLQMGVRKVQKHFVWHIKPVKYDLFHMILHSIWYNRVHTIRPR